MNKQNNSSGIEFGDALTLVFIVLKLTGNIGWSWWWVLSPIWIPLALCFVMAGLIVAVKG